MQSPMIKILKCSMELKYIVLSCILFLSFLSSYSQTTIQGSVKDAETHEDLPWCSISLKGTRKGAFSNSEGTFAITVNIPSDTLLFSYVGFKVLEIPSSVVSQKRTVFLERTGIQLEELTVHADNDYLYDILDQCRKNVSKNKQYHVAKVYYGIETQSEEQPIELLECYYNGYLKGLSIESLLFRNGRIGLAEMDKRYFLTLNSSLAISRINLTRQDPYFPSNPLQYTKNRLKKIFNLTIKPGENGMYRIGFQPFEEVTSHFSGEMWIDRKTLSLVRIDLTITDAMYHPFVPLFKVDRLSHVDIKISQTFKNDGSASLLDHINFSYHFNYKSVRDDPGSMVPSVIQREISTAGVLCLYDLDDPFFIPRFDYDANYDDYRKMSIIPFNKIFWDNNNTLILTEKQKEGIGFFTDNGLLVNFEEGSYGKDFLTLTHYDSSLYQNCYTFWDSAQRFSLNRNLPQNKVYSQRQIHSSILTDQYNLDILEVQLLLDVTKVDNSFYFKSYTVFDEKKSQFHLPEGPETKAFLNIFFDLCEIERRKMEKVLDASSFSVKQIDSIYYATIGNMKEITSKFRGEVRLGKNKKAMLTWNSVVLRNLGIDNLKIFKETEGN
jgi:hypothetical protein